MKGESLVFCLFVAYISFVTLLCVTISPSLQLARRFLSESLHCGGSRVMTATTPWL